MYLFLLFMEWKLRNLSLHGGRLHGRVTVATYRDIVEYSRRTFGIATALDGYPF